VGYVGSLDFVFTIAKKRFTDGLGTALPGRRKKWEKPQKKKPRPFGRF